MNSVNPVEVYYFKSGKSTAYLRQSVDGSGVVETSKVLKNYTPSLKWNFLKQIHGAEVISVDGNELVLTEGDALVSAKKNQGLAVFGGDCPGLAIDAGDVFGLAHCGWRGTVKGIVENLFFELQKKSNKSLSEWEAYIGPSICGDCYEVDAAVLEDHDWPKTALAWEKEGKAGLDLREAIRFKLVQLGLKKEQITLSSCCTFEREDLHSYRQSGKGVNQLLCMGQVEKLNK